MLPEIELTGKTTLKVFIIMFFGFQFWDLIIDFIVGCLVVFVKMSFYIGEATAEFLVGSFLLIVVWYVFNLCCSVTLSCDTGKEAKK